jgi:hypothetical protein
VPEEYGGAGADALATVLVIEEIARVCVASSLIPAVNKLGSLPVILAGSEEMKKKYLTRLASGDGGFSYCLSEPDAGSDAVGDEDARGPRRRRLGARRREALDHQRRRLGVLHGDGRHRPREAHARASRRSWSRSPTRASPSAPGEEARHQGQPDPRGLPRQRPDPRRPDDRREGTGFETAMQTLDHTRVTIAAQAVGVAQGRSTTRSATPRSASSSASRSPTSRACSSCSPTWA